ncbi:Villin headpiece domain containing protein [Balamuthia mandrillaris]
MKSNATRYTSLYSASSSSANAGAYVAKALNDGARKSRSEYEALRESSEAHGSFSVLPPELMLLTFSFFDFKTLGHAAQVCHYWNFLSQDCVGLLGLNHERQRFVVDWLLTNIADEVELLMMSSSSSRSSSRTSSSSSSSSRSSSRSSSSSSSRSPDCGSRSSSRKRAVDAKRVDGTRIDFIQATTQLLRDYFSAIAGNEPQTPEFVHLLAILNKSLLETRQSLEQISSGQMQLNDQFDIFELTLRRYYEQFKAMFPTPEDQKASKPLLSASHLIQDRKARRLWEECVGPDDLLIDFETFFNKVFEEKSNLQEKVPNAGDRQQLHHHLTHFLNFPKDDTVTTYKWDLLTRLFGPYDDLLDNFLRFVLGQGFLGLINRIKAEEILKSHRKKVLIRFSRTAPSSLAFSYSDGGGAVYHYTNNASWFKTYPEEAERLKRRRKKDSGEADGGETVLTNFPIGRLLKLEFEPKGIALVPMRVDGRAIANAKSLTSYIATENASGGYLVGA